MKNANRRNIYLLCLVSFLQGMVFYGPIATLYRTSVGVSVGQIALIESISYLLVLALEVPSGLVTARIGYRNMLVLCCAVYFVSKLVFWRAGSFAMFLLERVLLSVVMAGLSGCDSAFLFVCAGERGAQRAFGFYNACGTAGLAAASVCFSLFVGENYRLAALLTAVSYGAALAAALFLRPVPMEVQDAAPLRAQLRGLVQNVRARPVFLVFLLAGTALREVCQLVTVFFSQLLYVDSGVPVRAMGFLYLALTLTGLCEAFSHRATSAAGPARFGAAAYGLAALACLALALGRGAMLCVLCVFALRAVASLYQPYFLAGQNANVGAGARSVLLSGYSMIGSVAASGLNWGLGCAADTSLSLALLICAGLCALGGAGFLYWRSRMKLQEKKEPEVNV